MQPSFVAHDVNDEDTTPSWIDAHRDDRGEKIASGRELGFMDKRVVGEGFPAVLGCFESFAWQHTPVGSPSTWPIELHIAFSIIHNSEVAAALYIDPTQKLMFWNDQYAQTIVRSKHPRMYGMPGIEVYAEVEGIEDMIGGVFRDKKSFTATAFRCYLKRTVSTYEEESYFDFTMGPLLNPAGEVYAVLNFANDVTQQNLLARRIEILSTLATRGARAQSVEGVCHSFVHATKSSIDLPWMAVYVAADVIENKADKDLTDEINGDARAKTDAQIAARRSKTKLLRLVATTFDANLIKIETADSDMVTDSGSTHENHFDQTTSTRILPEWLPVLPPTTPFHSVFREPARRPTVPSSPAESSCSGSNSTASQDFQAWPFLDLTSDTPYIVLSTPSAENPTAETIIMPITTQSLATGDRTVLGVLVAGLNVHRLIDHEYLNFFTNVTKQLEGGIINGRARRNDRRTAEALRRLNYQRVQFFQNTAHELRTPLTLMLGPLEELVRAHTVATTPVASASNSGFALPPIVQTLSRLSLISRNARRLLKLVNSILRFSSIEAGKLETKFMRQPHFGAVTKSLCECFESLAAQSGIGLRFAQGLVGIDNTSSVHGSQETTLFDRTANDTVREEIFVDTELWEQILFNLISNAFKHTWKGSITCSLYDHALEATDGFRFEIADTGVGIDKMHRDSVFERFYRADNSDSRTSEGTGIGLSLVKELARLHGGKVGLVSELGVGSTFWVWMPRGLDHLPRDKIFENVDPGLAEAHAFKNIDSDGIEVYDNDAAASAMDRWNSRARGIERTSILEQVDFWVNEPARGPQEIEMDDRTPLAPESPLNTELTPTPTTSRLTAKNSYFPLIPEEEPSAAMESQVEDITMANDFAPALKRQGGLKRKLSDVTTSQKNTSAKRDPPVSTPVTSWYSRTKPKEMLSPPTTTTQARSEAPSSILVDDFVDEEGMPRLRGLPFIDPSDRPTILMCDDNPDMRLWISSLLQTDYNVIEARNGSAALEILATVVPDLVLSDVMMPIIDGTTLVRRIRNNPRLAQVPVILLSARSGEEDSLEGLDAGADDYVVKPFSPRDLLARCRVHIRLSRMRRQTAEYESELIRLQSRTDAKNSLLGLVSHELRTPLSSIVGALDLLKNESTGSRELIETMSRGAETLRGRIDQLLDVAKVDSSSFVLSVETFDLDAVISTALGRHAVTVAKKGVQVFSIVGRAPATVVSDRERLLQVLDSLLSNAAKFTEKGEVVLRCWVENELGEELEVYGNQESYLCFAVSDSGPGIPEELASQIFLPFQLADSTSTRRHGGAGLGLALALRVVERAGGQIGVESTVGKGSEFRFRWPMRMAASAAELDSSDVEPVVLVVSTRPTLAQSIYCSASIYSWDTIEQVDTFEAAIEAVQLYDGPRPLVFFVDDHLVEADPVKSKALLSNLTPCSSLSSSPVLGRPRAYAVVTSHVDDSAVRRSDFHGVVSPPYHRTQVLSVVSDILSKRRRPSIEQMVVSRPESPVYSGDPFPRGRLLIAEDNKINAKLLIRQLKTLGYAADEAEHGLRVLDLIQAEALPTSPPVPGSPVPPTPKPYRGILMDLDMPQMDGFEATRRVRSMGGRFQSMPIMAVTANAQMGDKEKCLGAGMDDFVSKPISIAQLTALLQRNGLYSMAATSDEDI